jgi:hypothetical protein
MRTVKPSFCSEAAKYKRENGTCGSGALSFPGKTSKTSLRLSPKYTLQKCDKHVWGLNNPKKPR